MEKVLSYISDFSLARNFSSFISDSFEITTVSKQSDAVSALVGGDYSLIMIYLPSDKTAPEYNFLDDLCKSETIENIPVAGILEAPNLETEVNLFTKGCSELFYTPFDSILIRKRLQNLIKIHNLKRNILTYEKQLITDPMTGLLNKSGFQSLVRKVLRLSKPGAFIMCDMDDLKYINDNYSHQTGDDMIVAFADCLFASMPEDAFIAHVSGDEFCVYLNNMSDKIKVGEICSHFQKILLQKALLPDLARPITASIGIVMFPEGGSTFDILANRADHAMIYVKNHGKNSFKFHEPRDDREELLKGRQICTNMSMELMLKPREDEDTQTWLKFGEFRIVFATYQKFMGPKLMAQYCLLNITDRGSPENPDSEKIRSINDKITAFIKDAMLPGVFSWYSINQLLVLTTKKETLPQGIERLKQELSDELEALKLEIELVNA